MASERKRKLVRNIVLDRLRKRFGENADIYEDDEYRIGVAFPDGQMVDVHIGGNRS